MVLTHTLEAVWLLALFAAGCGVPGEPLPPLLEIPAPVSDLSATQIGASVHVTWSRPLLTTEGTRARFLDRMEIYGVVLPEGTPLESFPQQSKVLATIRPEELAGGQTQVVYDFPLTAAQRHGTAWFAVKAVNHRGSDAGFSRASSLEIVDLPEPPGKLQATVTETAIRLRWEPAPRSVFGGRTPQADGYQVYRADSGTPAPGQPLGETSSPAYEDTSFEMDRHYAYSVRTFAKRGESVALTPFSSAIPVDAVDRFPPAAPQNLRAIAVAGAVEMAWSPNSEPDLAGYNVYRSEGGSFTKWNAAVLSIPLFRDGNVTAGVSYSYLVRAVDTKGNQSGPSEPAAVTAE